MTDPPPSPTATPAPPPSRPSRDPLRWLLDLFSNVRFGVFLMVVLFVYCALGSAGILYPAMVDGRLTLRHEFIRQWRMFEMTEYEWFNTPFFVGLVGAMCLSMAIVTVRRIRFNTVNLGVWMIHAGIIGLALSSVWYFATKVEGDTPVFRWRILAEVPGRPPVSMAALAGNGMQIDAPDGAYTFRVAMMQPDWPIISPGFEGKTAYALTISCATPRGMFERQLLDGYPQFTQDLIVTAEGRKRVKTMPEFEGRVLFDEQVTLSLVPDPQEAFWVKDSAVMSVREVAGDTRRAGAWFERSLAKLPRYNDYASKSTDAFVPTELMGRWRATPLSFEVPPADDRDPLTGVKVRVTGHLRYAQMQTQFMPGGDAFNPVANVTLAIDGQAGQPMQLVAADPAARSALAGLVELRTVSGMDEVRDLSSREAQRLVVTVAATGESIELNLDELNAQSDAGTPADFTEIGASGYAVRFRQVLDHRPQSPDIGAVIDIRTPDRVFARWVPIEAGKAQDFVVPEGGGTPKSGDPSPEITAVFDAGIPPITLVAGPGEVGLRAIGRLVDLADGLQLHSGASVKIQDRLTLTVDRYLPDARMESRPVIVPPERRNKNIEESRAATLVRVEIDDGKSVQTEWLPFDRYLLDDPSQQSLVSGEQPARFTLADGRTFDIAVGRRRMELPSPVVLRDFELVTHVGGFSGNAASVRDWRSHVAFETPEGFTQERTVAVNQPKPFGGYWYFQSFWDAPNAQRGTPGLSFTGLGVGNRNGVQAQLITATVSVVGMIYAFYFKPIIKRRRAERVRAAVERGEFGKVAQERAASGAPAGGHS